MTGPGPARELILSSALFDQEWYAGQAGTTFADRGQAVDHYLAHARTGWSPHPLFSAPWVYPRGGWADRAVDPLSHYLSGRKRFLRPPHPLLHLGRIVEAAPAAGDAPLGPADHWVRHAAPDTAVPSPRGALTATWGALREVLAAAGPVPAPGQAAATVPGRVSVVLPLSAGAHRVCGWMLSLFREHGGMDLEVVAVGDPPSEAQALAAQVAAAVPRAVVVTAGPEVAASLRAGVLAVTGEHVVLVTADAEAPYWPWLAPLVRALRSPDGAVASAQPVLLAADRTIASAGVTFLDGRFGETPLLRGMAESDAARLVPGTVPAVGDVVAMRTDLVRTLGVAEGVPDEHLLTDLSVRAWRAGHGAAACVPDSALVVRPPSPAPTRPGPVVDGDPPPGSAEAWSRAGYLVVTDGAGEVAAAPRPRPRLSERPPSLRWTIDTSVTAGPWSRRWGDHHFATALASALERLGQRVSVDPRESRGRASRAHDDVVLVLRGRDAVTPPARPGHVLWVISHPDQVTAEEASAYDLVLAASESWARAKAEEWRLPVRPLLQCTDPARFHPGLAEPDSGHPLLFVGNARDGGRPVVAAALEAGLEPAIYGADWAGLVPTRLVVADHVDNADLGALYAGAGVVLNDHWADMRRLGFLANRVYDAAATGTRVVSDQRPGVASLDRLVRTWSTPAQLRELVVDRDRHFPTGEERRADAERVAAEHSFDARALALLDAVLLPGPLDRPAGPGGRRSVPPG